MTDVTEITVQQLHALEGAVVIDVREIDEYVGGRAVGAVNIPMSEIGARLEELPQDGEQFFVICRSGGRSGSVVDALRPRGFDAVNVAGGTLEWAAAGYDIER